MIDLTDLLIFLLRRYKEKYGQIPSKTKLLKLAYISDLFYYRKLKKRLLNFNWIYYLYGPWTDKYDSIIDRYPFKKKEYHESQLIDIDSDYKKQPKLDFDEKEAVIKALYEYGDKDLNEILDFVYFDTEPMMNARNRGETLDFSTVKDESFYKIKEIKIDSEIKKKLKKEYFEKLKNARKI